MQVETAYWVDFSLLADPEIPIKRFRPFLDRRQKFLTDIEEP
jgi:hypothetical protein